MGYIYFLPTRCQLLVLITNARRGWRGRGLGQLGDHAGGTGQCQRAVGKGCQGRAGAEPGLLQPSHRAPPQRTPSPSRGSRPALTRQHAPIHGLHRWFHTAQDIPVAGTPGPSSPSLWLWSQFWSQQAVLGSSSIVPDRPWHSPPKLHISCSAVPR